MRLSLLSVVVALVSLVAAAPSAQRQSGARPRPMGFDAPLTLDLSRDIAAAEDLNGDGLPELVTFYDRYGTFKYEMGVWLNRGGLSFEPGGLTYVQPSGSFVTNLEIGDVTRDGIPDVVGGLDRRKSTGKNGLLVYPGLGDGRFGAPIIRTTARAEYAAIGDFDGDGQLEIGLAQAPATGPRTLRIWTWDGVSFSPGQALQLTESAVTRLVAEDVTGDGTDDLVTLSMRAPVYFAGVYPVANGRPTKGAEVTATSWNLEMHTGDLDGNGLWDVTFVDSTTNNEIQIEVIEQTSVGTFVGRPMTTIALPTSVTSSREDWHRGRLVDVDLDGLVDYVGGDVTLAYLRNLGEGAFAFEAEVVRAGGLTAVADIDGDRIDDLVLPRSLLLGTGRFRDLFLPSAKPFGPGVEGVVDLDGDGDLDAWDYGSQRSTLLNRGDGSFEIVDSEIASPPYRWSPIAYLDFDGDTDFDYAINVYSSTTSNYIDTVLLANDGHGVYSFEGPSLTGGVEIPTPFVGPVAAPPLALAADLDGDGDLDLAGFDGWWARGTSPPFAPAGTYPCLPSDTGDCDGDGDVDLVGALTGSGGGLCIARNDGTGVFTIENHPTYLGDNAQFLDADGDGDLDIYTYGYLLENVGGTFVPIPTIGFASFDVAVSVGDVDGEPDLFGADGSKVVVYRKRPGPLAYDPPLTWYAGGRVRAIFDADGDLDVLSNSITRGLTFTRATSGGHGQFATGVPGAGGFAPLLGAVDPKRAGQSARLRLRGAVGGTTGELWLGGTRAQALYPGTTAVPLVVGDAFETRAFVLPVPSARAS